LETILKVTSQGQSASNAGNDLIVVYNRTYLVNIAVGQATIATPFC